MLAYPMPNSCLWASRLQHPEGSEVVTKPKSVCLLVSKTSLIWPSAASLGLATGLAHSMSQRSVLMVLGFHSRDHQTWLSEPSMYLLRPCDLIIDLIPTFLLDDGGVAWW